MAYTCATTGGLKQALQAKQVDDQLLNASGEIIQALLIGGPAQDMDDYEDGPAVLEAYMARFVPRASAVTDFLRAIAIRRWLEGAKADWAKRAAKGWTEELRTRLIASARDVIERPTWKPLVLQEIRSEDYGVMFRADQAAKELGLDVWEFHWERLHKAPGNENLWPFALQTSDRARIEKVVSLAEEVLPLSQIASGPADEMGMGDPFKAHRQLDWVLQALDAFPGIGGRLVLTGLRSPTIRNRTMALRDLSAWGREHWPEGAEAVLRDALQHEPDPKIRENIQKALDGVPLAPPNVVVP